jgi:hypothetical protein
MFCEKMLAKVAFKRPDERIRILILDETSTKSDQKPGKKTYLIGNSGTGQKVLSGAYLFFCVRVSSGRKNA